MFNLESDSMDENTKLITKRPILQGDSKVTQQEKNRNRKMFMIL